MKPAIIKTANEHLSRIQLPIDYDPNVECPAWDEFLSKVINKNDIEKILEWIGYCTYYGLPIQKALILFGPGRNVQKHFTGWDQKCIRGAQLRVRTNTVT